MLPKDLATIYERVKCSGIPNSIGVRIPVPSGLNLPAWDQLFAYDSRHSEMLDFIRYGFPLGYMGPISHYDQQYNHSTATNFSEHIDQFIEKEISLGGIVNGD